jgi:hypothetical protein
MKYKKQTEFFGIPVPHNEALNSDVEMLKMQIIENQLIAGTKGVKCAIFEEGEYSLEKDENDDFSVLLFATGDKPSINGILNGGYFEGKSRIIWDNLEKGYMHYLYVKWNAKTFKDKTAFRTFSTKVHRQSSNVQMLVAIVDLRGGEFSIECNPDGKKYATDISFHSNDYTNPHGKRIYQDQLFVRKRFVLNIVDDAVANPAIVIKDERNSNYPTLQCNKDIIFKDKRTSVQLTDDENSELKVGKSLVGAINEVGKNRADVLDFVSGGNTGTLISIEEGKRITAIHAHQRLSGENATQLPVGEIAIGYHSDGVVENPNEARIFNIGESGISMRAIIYYD